MRQYLAGSALLLAAQVAFADAEVVVALGDPSIIPVRFTDPTSVSHTESSVPPLLEFGTASADLATGVVRARAVGYLSVASGAGARISDIVTITGPPNSSTVAQITFLISGSTTSVSRSPTALGAAMATVRSRSMIRQVFGATISQGLVVDFVHISSFFHELDAVGGVRVIPSFTFDDNVIRPPQIRQGIFLIPNPVQPPAITLLQPGFLPGSPSERGFSAVIVADVDVTVGDRFELFNQVEPSGAGIPGGAANMSNSGYVSIALPEGWGFTSDSGVLLSDPAELPRVEAVPQPWSAQVLLGLALAVAGGSWARAASRRAH